MVLQAKQDWGSTALRAQLPLRRALLNIAQANRTILSTRIVFDSSSGQESAWWGLGC